MLYLGKMWWILGLIGWILVLVGIYFTGEKKVLGFYLCIFAECFIIADAILFLHWTLIGSCVVFTCLNAWNIWKWQFRNRDMATDQEKLQEVKQILDQAQCHMDGCCGMIEQDGLILADYVEKALKIFDD